MRAIDHLLQTIDRNPYFSPIPYFSGFHNGLEDHQVEAIRSLISVAPEEMVEEVTILLELIGEEIGAEF